MCPREGLCHLLCKSSDICDEEWILNEQEELLSQAEAVKASFEVSNQLIHEVNMRRNISLSLNLFLDVWEVFTVSLKIFLEHFQFPLEGADSCHQITNRVLLAL